MSLLAGRAVVGEDTTDALTWTVVEGINSLIGGYGIVIEALLIHSDRANIHSDIEGELPLVGGVGLGEDIDRLVVSSEGYLLEVVGDAELGNRSFVGD